MSQNRILIAEPENFSEKAVSRLNEWGMVECKKIEQSDVRRAMEDYDAIWIRLGLHVQEKDFPESLRCRYIITATTGTDHIDVSALEKIGVSVLSLRGEKEFLETIGVTAELALALIFALARRLPAAVHSVVHQGRWDRDAFRGLEIAGKTAGIVGLGRLGGKMAGYLAALDMRVAAYDPYAASAARGVRMCDSLDDLLARADVVTVHVPLNPETRGMFDAGRFGAMKRGALFVNTSRGALVDEPALLAHLENGHLGGAALDVLCGEPLIDTNHPLVRYAGRNDNLLITPHIGGAVEGAMTRCEEHMANLLIREMNTKNYQ